MAKVLLSAIVIVAIIVLAGVAYFAFTDIPPPAGKVEHVIPDSRLPK